MKQNCSPLLCFQPDLLLNFFDSRVPIKKTIFKETVAQKLAEMRARQRRCPHRALREHLPSTHQRPARFCRQNDEACHLFSMGCRASGGLDQVPGPRRSASAGLAMGVSQQDGGRSSRRGSFRLVGVPESLALVEL